MVVQTRSASSLRLAVVDPDVNDPSTNQLRNDATTTSAHTPLVVSSIPPSTIPQQHSNTSTGRNSQQSSLIVFDDWYHHNNVAFHHMNTSEAAAIRHALVQWYHTERRRLPWRGDPPPWNGSTASATTATAPKNAEAGAARVRRGHMHSNLIDDTSNNNENNISIDIQEQEYITRAVPVSPYGIWVSEIMLQQTRVETVIPYWCRWMQRFPTVAALALASSDQVNAAWAGLGYYRRARMLHEAAKYVVEQHHGIVPETIEGLLSLPGIGRYTASAIASIAYHCAVPVVDGNVCRVLCRLRAIAQHVKAPILKDDVAWQLAAQIVNAPPFAHNAGGQHTTTTIVNHPNNSNHSSLQQTRDDRIVMDHHPGIVNQALMELGATYCAPTGSGTHPNDPLRSFYWSTQLVHQCRMTTKVRQQEQRALLTPAQQSRSKYCSVCGPHGVSQAMEQFETLRDDHTPHNPCLITLDNNNCGHKIFPLPPPKTTKREQVYAVAVLQRIRICDSCPLWLFVRRPSTGLLAGQWEFPSICLWDSTDDDSNSRYRQEVQQQHRSGNNDAHGTERRQPQTRQRSKVPTTTNTTSIVVPTIAAAKRAAALDAYLSTIAIAATMGTTETTTKTTMRQRRHRISDPVVHVFSHVRHTLWLETATIAPPLLLNDNDKKKKNSGNNNNKVGSIIDDKNKNRSSDKFLQVDLQRRRQQEQQQQQQPELQWMTVADMERVGMTALVYKVLRAVHGPDWKHVQQPTGLSPSSSSLPIALIRKQAPTEQSLGIVYDGEGGDPATAAAAAAATPTMAASSSRKKRQCQASKRVKSS